MKNVRKISIILAIICLINLFVNPLIMAAEDKSEKTDKSFTDVINEADDWLKNADTGEVDPSSIASKIKPIAQALTVIGTGIVLCAAVVMGIKWLTAKPDEQAKLKQQSVGLFVAAIVITGSYTIWSIALKILGNL